MYETPELVKLYDVANNITGERYSPSLKRSDAMALLQEVRERLDAIPMDERGEGDWSCDVSITYAGSTTTIKNPAAVALGKMGGSVKSDKKSKSSAANGALGGRPRKTPLTPGE